MVSKEIYKASEVGSLSRLIIAAQEYAEATTGKRPVERIEVIKSNQCDIDSIVIKFFD